MSPTNLDVLFQVAAPSGERSCFNMPRVDELKPGFGDHLSQASTTTLSDSGVAGSTSDQLPANNSSSNDESPSTEAPKNEIAPAAESAVSDRDDTDADEPLGVEESVATHSHDSDGVPAPVSADDSEPDTDDDEPHSDEAVVAVAENVIMEPAVIVTSTKLPASTAAEVAIVQANAHDGAVKSDQSMDRATAERTPAKLKTADTRPVATAATASDSVKAATSEAVTTPTTEAVRPTTPHNPIDKTVSSKATRNPRPAKPEAVAETEQQTQHGEQNGIQVGGMEQYGDVAVSPNSTVAESKAGNIDQSLSESAASHREASPDEDRDANVRSSARQRNDAAALANKMSAAAIPNVAATRSENIASHPEGSDGTARAGKAAAKVDGVGDATSQLHANASSSKRAGRVNSADEMPRIDPARFVGRVAKAFHTAQERGGTLQIRLSPPELGAMRLELTVKDGVMTAALETETASARRALLEHLPALRDRLAEQNIRVERFDVDVRREGNGGQADPRATQDQQQPQQGHSEQRRRQAAPPPITEAARQTKPITPARTTNDRINLVA